MSKRISISQPMVITTELQPLTESFHLASNGEPTSQWYYINTGLFTPDRRVDNLVLYPQMHVILPEDGIRVSPTLLWVRWYEKVKGGEYTPITNSIDGDVDYVCGSDFSLTVKKNVTPMIPVSIKCSLCYEDPRMAGMTYALEGTVTLVSNQNADSVFPKLNVSSPSKQMFNPIFDWDADNYVFTPSAEINGKDISSMMTFDWQVIDKASGSVSAIPASQWAGTISEGRSLECSPRYSENFTVICRAKFTYGTLSPTLFNKAVAAGDAYERKIEDVAELPSGSNPSELGLFEKELAFYYPTKDVVPMSGKQYFSISYHVTTDNVAQEGKFYYTRTMQDFIPDKIYRNVSWEEPRLKVEAASAGGNSIYADTISKVFSAIVNTFGKILTEEEMREHLLFEWKTRSSNSSREEAAGFGSTITLPKSSLVAGIYNKLVFPYVYLKGALRKVTFTDNSGKKHELTHNGEPIYARD